MSAEKGSRSPYLLLCVTMLLWGSAFSSSKTVVEEMPHTVAALLRFGGGAVALLAAVAVSACRTARTPGTQGSRGGSLAVTMRSRHGNFLRTAWRAGLAGVLGVFAYNGFLFWGLSLAPSLDAGALVPVLSPVLTSLFLLLTGAEQASRTRLAGLALGLAGAAVFLVGASGTTHGSPARPAGDALFVLSAGCWAAYTLVGPRVLAGLDPLRATTYATCMGAVLLGVLAAPDLAQVHWSTLPTGLWLNVLYLAVGAAAVANLFYYRAVGTVGPASASLMMFTVPVVNTVCATVFLGESFAPVQGLGAAGLLAGAVLAVRSRGRADRTAMRSPLAHVMRTERKS
ncbi:DMT family transporter [Streptomyces sp. Li-HN-5-11]|uniref:DMT family transporter n=1 Tax=Streptomyces sp. Li-HN-5-11 TaxID=3075432 RepID=UPI0028B0FEE1|nr:DMT family transporter [Streptomyces sp. Li-HN-5-11]WNM36267.1 DMT family transporter [Streptomyces sp. Li-HN-5-11]